MATATYEEADDRGTITARRSSGSRGTSTTSLKAATSVLNTATILELVERLGLVDMVVERVKGRIEEVDIDDVIDEIGDYLKRNPEVLVVALGAITIATGALVYLNKRHDGGSRPRSTASSASSKKSTGSRSKSRS
ncbi:MAG TPA: hypothetical protein VMM79_18335 [Longimicrobiales bacterium]|nr:hypothetical protein [Longimicrobiales bacterium]